MFRLRLLLVVLAIGFYAIAQDPDDEARGKQSVLLGKSQFVQTCGFCHGLDGRGGASGPDLIRSVLVSHDKDGDLIEPVVRDGRPDKGMPAFQLPDADIRQIALFLHSEANGAASVARRIPSDYPLEKLLIGSAERGRAYFQAHCASCHSEKGDMEHIAAKYKPFDLQTRIVFPSGAKPVVTVRDANGRTFSGEQVYADEFVVTLRDRDRWTHSFRRAQVRLETRDPLAEHEKLLSAYSDADVHDLFAYLETLK